MTATGESIAIHELCPVEYTGAVLLETTQARFFSKPKELEPQESLGQTARLHSHINLAGSVIDVILERVSQKGRTLGLDLGNDQLRPEAQTIELADRTAFEYAVGDRASALAVLRGKLSLEFVGQTHSLEPGQVAFTRSELPYKLSTPNGPVVALLIAGELAQPLEQAA